MFRRRSAMPSEWGARHARRLPGPAAPDGDSATPRPATHHGAPHRAARHTAHATHGGHSTLGYTAVHTAPAYPWHDPADDPAHSRKLAASTHAPAGRIVYFRPGGNFSDRASRTGVATSPSRPLSCLIYLPICGRK